MRFGLVLCAVVVAASPVLGQTNLLTNGGFDGSLAGWQTSADVTTSKVQVTHAPEDAANVSSSGSLRADVLQDRPYDFVNGFLSGGWSVMEQTVGIVPGVGYTLSGRITGVGDVGLKWLKPDGSMAGQYTFSTQASSGSPWELVTTDSYGFSSGLTAPSDAVRVKVSIGVVSKSGAVAYYDNISLSVFSPPTPSPTLALTPPTQTVATRGTAIYTAVMSAAQSSPTTLTLSTSDPTVALVGSPSLTIPAGSLMGTFTVTGLKSGTTQVNAVLPDSLGGSAATAIVVVEDTACQKGDLDGNGQVNPADAVLVLQSVVRSIVLTAAQTCAGDYDTSGAVDTGDAILILRCYLGLGCR